MRFAWREDVWLPPTTNCSSYCKSCKGYTYWKEHKTIIGENRVSCTKCGRIV